MLEAGATTTSRRAFVVGGEWVTDPYLVREAKEQQLGLSYDSFLFQNRFTSIVVSSIYYRLLQYMAWARKQIINSI